MNNVTTETVREDTMIYRTPTENSDETAIQDIWGERLEVRVVDASEVGDLLAEGWVNHPLEIGKEPAAPAPSSDEVQASKDALEAAEKLVAALTDANKSLKSDLDAVTAERDMRKDVAADAEAKLATAIAERNKLAEDLKAAEALAGEEAKAKDAALAELATLKAAAEKAKGGKS